MSPRVAAVVDVEVAEPGVGEISVEAAYSLISAGTEMHFYRGETDAESRQRLVERGTLDNLGPFPIRFGYQVVGIVRAVGPESGFDVGDAVFVRAPHQSRFTVASTQARRLRPGLDLRTATFTALTNVALTAHLDAPVRIGDCVVVFGLGVIGNLLARLARPIAGTLVLVDPIESRRRCASSIGADALVAPEDAAAAVHDCSGGRGADLAFEASGAAAALQSCLATSGVESTICVVAFYGTQPVPLVLAPEFHLRRQRILSSQVGRVTGELQARWSDGRRIDVAMDVLDALGIDDLITHEFALEDAARAYALVDDRPEKTLGVVLRYGDD